jgi:hypothetical protein
MQRLSSWRKEWWCWLTSRERQAASQFLGCFSMASFGFLFLAAVLYLMGHPQEASGADDMLILIIVGILFLWYFILIFLLSFHSKTRAFADRNFHFKDQTELEELKMKIENIENRLKNIETALKPLAKKENKGGKG